MENPTQPNSDGTTPKLTDTEALSILSGCLRHAFEANREWSKFGLDPEQRKDQEAELADLERAEAWLAALPEPVAFLHAATEAQLENELRRRGCAVVVITPDDVAEQWRTNQDADETDEPAPTERETRAALAFVQRRLDRTVHENEPAFEWGATSDACEWITAARHLESKKGGAK